MSVDPKRRKLRLHISLRVEIVEALERSAEESDMSVSRVVENLLGYQLELESIRERERVLTDVVRSFRRRT